MKSRCFLASLLSFFTLFLSLGVGQVHAGLKKKVTPSKTTVEVYPSMEEVIVDEPDMSIVDTKALEDRLVQLEKKMAKNDGLPRESQVQQNLVSTATAAKFYEVPESKREMLSRRLPLVEAILKETGRAYDYRSMTTPELEAILKAAKDSSKSTQK